MIKKNNYFKYKVNPLKIRPSKNYFLRGDNPRTTGVRVKNLVTGDVGDSG